MSRVVVETSGNKFRNKNGLEIGGLEKFKPFSFKLLTDLVLCSASNAIS
jgi:hypothetical protein